MHALSRLICITAERTVESLNIWLVIELLGLENNEIMILGSN